MITLGTKELWSDLDLATLAGLGCTMDQHFLIHAPEGLVNKETSVIGGMWVITPREGGMFFLETVPSAVMPETADESPDIETLMDWEANGGYEATDGCSVESDGICPHGKESWLKVLGMI